MKKAKGLPRFENPPPLPPPPKRKLNTEESVNEIIALLNDHPPAEQNKILESVINKIVVRRVDEYRAANTLLRETSTLLRETSMNLEKFLSNTRGVEEFLKARDAVKELSK